MTTIEAVEPKIQVADGTDALALAVWAISQVARVDPSVVDRNRDSRHLVVDWSRHLNKATGDWYWQIGVPVRLAISDDYPRDTPTVCLPLRWEH